ncbi:hypothetical protein CYMTET_36564, partial [Cymbomonas tetramitiformis]
SFGATAFDSGGRDSGEDSPNDVVAGLASEPSSDGEALSDDPNGALAEPPSEPTSASEPSLHPLTSDAGSDSDGDEFWAKSSKDTGSGSDGVGAGSSGAEGRLLERVAALAADVRPTEFVGAVGEDSSSDPLSFFASKREANGAFALLSAAVRRQAIEDHAAGKPATWHAQAAAALQQGRQLVAEGRPRVKRRQVRWSDQVAAVAPPVEREPKSQAANAAPTAPPVPALEPREDEIDESVSPGMWQQLRDLEKEFEDVICTELPESVQAREYKASVRLRPDWQGNPLHRKGYKLSQEELRQLRLQLDELLAKGYIRPSASPWGCPVLMVPKPSNPKELRLVIDYRQINEITIKDKYPLPDVQSLLDDLQGATVFSTMDALWGFWQIPMSADDVEKTAMTTHFGAYEWLVMPMGLSNSPSTWQRMMTQYLGHLPFCRVFVDAIMIFSADEPGEGGAPGRDAHQVHLDHLRQVLEACRKNSVYLKKPKVKLCKRAVRFLGHVVDRDGCRPQQDKVASVRDWPDLETVTHARQFLGMCGFYRRYIQSFADQAYPLTRLTKSGVEWAWGKEEKEAFNRLKAALISSPTLALPDQRGAADGSRPFCVQTDASGVALGRVLMVSSTVLRSTDGPRVSERTDVPSKETPQEADEDKDPTSVLDAVFEYSDSEDESVPPTSPPVVIGELTHLNGLTWAETPDLWSDAADTLRVGEKALEEAESLAAVTRSARVREKQSAAPAGHGSPQVADSHYDRVVDRQDWKLIKERFDEIVTQYGPFDVDACCDSMGVNRQVEHFWTDCLKKQWRGKHVWCNPPYTKDSDLIERILRHFLAEWRCDPENTSAMFLLPDYDAPWRRLTNPPQRTDTFRMVDNMIWRVAEGRYQLVLSQDSPLRELVMREAHESHAAGHTGRDKTLDRVNRRFWWPRTSRDVTEWCKSCPVCQQTRPRNGYPDGQLNPLQVPVRLWQVVSIDFVTGLPRTERGYDAFATFTDKLSKMVHVVPMLYADSSAAQVARMYFDQIWRLHGAPMKIVCHRDSRFRDEMHLELHRLMGVQVASTTPYHPQGDGQAEHTNHTVERMLRAYVDANQQDWDLWCTPVEFAINDSRSAVTGFTPFELMYGPAPASQLDFFVEAALASRGGRAKGGRGVAVKKGTAHETARQFVRQLQLAREKLLLAQQQQIAQYDARHRARSYAIGDEVWVNATHLTQPGDRGLHKKLLKKRLGPLRLLAAFHSDRQMALPPSERGAPSAYRLQTPKQWKVHDVFTVDRISPVESSSRFVERAKEIPPPPVHVSGRKETHVECIERSRTRQHKGRRWTEYLVKWTGMPRSENEWKTREDLEWDGAGRPGVPNRALVEFEKVEAKRVQREKLRVQRQQETAVGAAVPGATLEYRTQPDVTEVQPNVPSDA